MKKAPWIAGAALAVSFGVAAYAAAPEGPPKTRAEVQARVAEHFKKADSNGDGYVSRAEADAARGAMKAKFAERREDRREQHFAMLDADKNGALSKGEYMAAPARGEGRGDHGGHGKGMRHRAGMGMGMGGAWFDRADADKDGKVSLAEASAGALTLFDRVDINKDGTISSEEQKAARDAMRAKWQERRGKEG